MSDPVLIVGAGPTGLTAALELSRLGVPVRLIDKRDAPATTSRAIGVQARTLELLDQRGLAEELVRLGNPGRYGSVYGGGKRVFHLDFAHVESRYPYILFVSQAETERVLREACASHGVLPEWKSEIVGIQQDAHAPDVAPAHAVLEGPDGALERVAAPWIIAAEGAHSLVRTTLDLPFEGHTRTEDYALGDLKIDGALADTDFHIFSSEHGFMGLFPMGGEHFRLIASNPLSAPSKDTAPPLEELQAIYDQRSPIPARFHDLTWSSWFRINSRMVPRLRIGRLFLGGDAAHIHSPAGAQGMNTGIQDMINLCWKLALVSRGEAPADLLDTYEADRLPVMRSVLSRTDSLTTTIGTENLVVRTLFNHLGPWIVGVDRVQANATATMAQIALGYRDSPLSEDDGHPGALRAGDRMPDLPVQQWIEGAWRQTHLHRALDPSHPTLVLALPDEGPRPEDFAGADGHVVQLASAPDDAGRFVAAFGDTGSAVLVRPDSYAGWIGPLAGGAERVRAYRDRWFARSHDVGAD
ncbi:FAD-dependent oxidoreductase [Methylobacterium sp. J-030]|uniref:FAD-dependent oxidoreductase n=1 Tax=Methylobacterium sp. J-030 TaxID=2836627 RepID=UPI001FB9C5D5|nr:FAD-dependent oxidoreductase [Methylobacterium sp. J-030]MCJ2072463.1 FAD-dependent oxidoreductase [Methylobacterium sp. J-030]